MKVKELRDVNRAFLNGIIQKNNGIHFNLDAFKLMEILPDSFVDTIYFDPPFSRLLSKDVVHQDDRNRYEAVDWHIDRDSFSEKMIDSCLQFKRILKSSGSAIIHLPWDLAYDLKPVIDNIFRKENLKNEIIWTWRAWNASKNRLQEHHHTLFWYTMSADNYVFNEQTMPRAQSTRKRFGNEKIVSAHDANGRRIPSTTEGSSNSAPLNDVWVYSDNEDRWLYELSEIDEVDYVENHARKLIGISHEAPIKKLKSLSTGKTYPWQKPAALLERLISMTTPAGGVVADFFSGTGTAGVASFAQGRKFLLNDISSAVCVDAATRLNHKLYIPGLPLSAQSIDFDANSKAVDGRQFQFWCGYTLGGISDDFLRGADTTSGIDVYIPHPKMKQVYIPGEVKKKFSSDEWLKTEGKLRALVRKGLVNKLEGYAVITYGLSPQVQRLITSFSSETGISVEVIDFSHDCFRHLIKDSVLPEVGSALQTG